MSFIIYKTDPEKKYNYLIRRKADRALIEVARWGASIKAVEALYKIKTPMAIKALEDFSREKSDVKEEVKKRARILLKEVNNEK